MNAIYNEETMAEYYLSSSIIDELNSEQIKKKYADLLNNKIWTTSTNKKIYVKNMTTSHIENCINCFNAKKQVFSELINKDGWLKVFNDELNNRK